LVRFSVEDASSTERLTCEFGVERARHQWARA
jgi:hypothetical protein